MLPTDPSPYLNAVHSKSVIHGDLTGANILISHDNRACLVDFGLSSIIAKFEGSSYWSSTVGGAIRWLAPELLPQAGSTPILTPACDVYSFGSVMLEVSRMVDPRGRMLISFRFFRRYLEGSHIITSTQISLSCSSFIREDDLVALKSPR